MLEEKPKKIVGNGIVLLNLIYFLLNKSFVKTSLRSKGANNLLNN